MSLAAYGPLSRPTRWPGPAAGELTDQHSALTATITPRHMEVLHLVTPAPQRTQLQLTYRWPASSWLAGKVKNQALKRQLADLLQVQVDGYKKLIDNAEDS
jgi:hypothetical protein